MKFNLNFNPNRNHLWFLLAFALLLRLISLAIYPLMDTTEARYGEMARLMVETGNWLTPQFDYGVPFWGKPPLFTWMSAYGIELFGVNEFAVRAPHWIAGVLTILIIAFLAKKSGFNALFSSVVIATCGVFAIASGAVMTDMALTLSITIAMTGFYFCWLNNNSNKYARWWGWLGFIGLGLGLLAKGPVAIVIMGFAVLPWLIFQHGIVGAFTQLWRRFPIVTGCALMLIIALPWYVMADMATPGFIDYFIVGENFKRFVVSGWEGDLYGSAHDQPRGMIWLFWLQSALPWSIVLPVLVWRRRHFIKDQDQVYQGLFSFLLFWLISPLLLFTLSGNILPAYVLPGIPALGLMVAMLVSEKDMKWFFNVSCVIPVLVIIALAVLNLGLADSRSDRVIFNTVQDETPVFYAGKRPFSGQFYSEGKAKLFKTPEDIAGLERFYFIGKKADVDKELENLALNCNLQLTANSQRSLYSCEKP